MLELAALMVFGLLGLGLLVALPVLLLVGLFKAILFVVLLPFRVLAAAAGALAGVIGSLVGVVVSVIGGALTVGGFLLALALGVGALLLLPLLPFVALFGLIWLFKRTPRGARA